MKYFANVNNFLIQEEAWNSIETRIVNLGTVGMRRCGDLPVRLPTAVVGFGWWGCLLLG